MKPVCPYCRGDISASDQYYCPVCQTPHHRACWDENGGCTVWGCTNAPGDDKKITISGQDDLSAGDYHTVVPPPPPSGMGGTTQYFIDRSGTRLGPYSLEDARRFFAQGLLVESDLAWCEGMPNWLPLPQVLGGGRRDPPPPPPPPPLAQAATRGRPGLTAGYGPSDKPKTYMVEAIFVTLLCCLPFGIPAIVFASQVDSKFNSGDFQGAQRASDNAKKWYHISLIVGLVVIVIWIIAAASGS